MLVEPKRIVILGAGFAGLYAALELERTVARDVLASVQRARAAQDGAKKV